MGIKSFIRNWLLDDQADNKQVPEPALKLRAGRLTLGHIVKDEIGESPETRFDIIDAMNGRIVRCSTFKHNPHGPDWTHQLYVMSDGESVGDAVNLLLVTKG